MKRVLLAVAAAAAVVVLIMRHVFAKRSIFTWHSMPLALTFFLSYTILPSCAHSYTFDGWGIFFSQFSILFALVLFSGIALIQTSLAIPNGLFMCSFESARTSGGLHVTCSLWIYCVLRWCLWLISGTQLHAHALLRAYNNGTATNYAEKEVKIII